MTRKFAGLQDYAVCKLEAQWWSDTPGENFARSPKEQWAWKLLIRTPDFVSANDVKQAVAVLRKRGKGEDVKLVQLGCMDLAITPDLNALFGDVA